MNNNKSLIQSLPTQSLEQSLPPPTAFGAPSKFASWRPGQAKSILRAIDNSKARFIVQVQPTGSGKSLCYIIAAVLSGKRVLILTSTKALQDQIISDFGKAFNIADVRGQSGYICEKDTSLMTTVENGPCHTGYECSLKQGGCHYYDAIRVAKNAQIVVSNYAFWLTIGRFASDAIGNFDVLVLDEAHDAPEWVMKAMSCSINDGEIERDVDLMPALPTGESVDQWKEWAPKALQEVEQQLQDISQMNRLSFVVGTAAKALRLRRYQRALANICALHKSNMVVDRKTVYGITLIEPITAVGLAERLLFRGIGRVLPVSATIRPKTMYMMGLSMADINEGKLVIDEYPSQFDLWRRPVIYVPTVKVQHDMSSGEVKQWVAMIDNIIRKRQDRKGIIHSVSYHRMRQIVEMSEFGHLMIGHDTRTINNNVKKFRESDAPRILVSPSLTTGYDFPYDQCEYQIISKIPFPDARTSAIKARAKNDKDYAYYIAMQTVVQSSGRACRADDDQSETFIVDNHWAWFINKYRSFAPKWFLDACVTRATIPEPPKRLERRKVNGNDQRTIIENNEETVV